MVILAAAILSRPKGQVLLSRQFTSMSQSYIETIWKLFSSLLNSNNSKPYTNYIEHENVRYIYQILDDIYIILLTNHLSNIIRDRQLVLTLSRMVSDICNSPGINQVQIHTFDILMGFDELINQAGLEDGDNSQRRNVMMKSLLMESMEEDKEESERKIKEKKVKKVMFQKAKEFAFQKMEGRRIGKRFELDSQSNFY